MSNGDFCIKCDKEISVYCGPCMDSVRDEKEAFEAEIERLHQRIEAIEKSHMVSLRLMEETSESWRKAHQAWSKWARELLYSLGRQPLHGEHGDTAAMAIIEQLTQMAPGVSRCSRCGCFSTLHEVEDEELRECSDCECTQYESP